MKNQNILTNYGQKLSGLLLLLFCATPVWAFDSGSTGSDGVFSPTSSTTVQVPANGIFNYTTLNIPSGVTVKFNRNVANTPVYILVQGDAVIDGDIDLSGLDGNVLGSPPPAGYAGGLPLLNTAGYGQGPGGGEGGSGPSNYGGAGGSYGSLGVNGGSTQVAPGQLYGSTALQPLLGGSGGGGSAIYNAIIGQRGGSGAGALLLAASGTLTLNGSILASGGKGSPLTPTINIGSGGGSGGGVRLAASTLEGTGTIDISGGVGGDGSVRDGGAGGDGRARLEADLFNFTGTVLPNVVAVSLPQPVFAATVPTVRITSIAGDTVPINPIGENDVVLPSTVANPVTVNFAATDVPLGTTLELTLTPSVGNIITVTSTALVGTVANSTASAQVTLPQGASVLFASVSFQ